MDGGATEDWVGGEDGFDPIELPDSKRVEGVVWHLIDNTLTCMEREGSGGEVGEGSVGIFQGDEEEEEEEKSEKGKREKV